MKKMMIAAGAAMLVLLGASCGQPKAPKELKSGDDSVACALSMVIKSNTMQELAMSRMQGQGMDSAQYLKGLAEGLADSAKASYFMGLARGAGMAKQMGQSRVDIAKFRAFFAAALKDTTARMDEKQAQEILNAHFQKIQEQEMEKQYGKNKTEGEKFMSEFKKKSGVKTTPKGVAYIVEKEGAGVIPAEGDSVQVSYIGTFTDGKEFDKSGDKPTTFAVAGGHGGVIEGWVEVLKQMKEGEKINCVIPYALAYGSTPSPYSGIEPFKTLCFQIELVKVIPAKKIEAPAAAAPEAKK